MKNKKLEFVRRIKNVTFLEIKLLFISNLLTLAGLLMLVISSFIIWGNLIDRDINENGIKIIAKIIESPLSCKKITKRGGYCKLVYNGKIYVEKAGKKFCHLVSGKKEVSMLTNKEGDKLLFPGQYDNFEFLSGFLLALISIGVIIKGYNNPF
ncbi:hypothetical protein [uncultured Aquimarina sp.]|uniref:hypothetical protein n=1 Tax=uncultured Aquimarina sp. TaxID=575652 RepID=UPI0026087894|nr:hypothetical protein [uncultured Aquimarina sp.]